MDESWQMLFSHRLCYPISCFLIADMSIINGRVFRTNVNQHNNLCRFIAITVIILDRCMAGLTKIFIKDYVTSEYEDVVDCR